VNPFNILFAKSAQSFTNFIAVPHFRFDQRFAQA